jgi:predicted metal-dependent hydrolase
MMVVKTAYEKLYPGKEFSFNPKLRYSGRFNDYNGNISLRGKDLTLNISREWKDVDDEIKIGLIQVLMNKIFKTKVKTSNMDLYNTFIKNIHKGIPKTQSDPTLEESFERVNEKYFSGSIERPNLRWGAHSMRTLGRYEYGQDMITISSIFKEAPDELIDLVMHHEALHKKHKFNSRRIKSVFHTSEFREDEKKFEDYSNAEKRLTEFLRKKHFRRIFRFF